MSGQAGDPEAPSANPFFTRHAHAYATSASHAAGRDLARLVELVTAGGGTQAVDVGTGTGHTAIALARAGIHVTGVDPTPAMLVEAKRLAAAEQVADRVVWVTGMAESLPVADGSADIVTCRRAAHHFTDVRRAVAEMARVLRPGGLLGISDLCPEADVAAVADRFEQLRDATHRRMLPEEGWRQALAAAGLHLLHLEVDEEAVSFDQWLRPLAPGGAEAAAIRQALDELEPRVRGRLTGMRGDGWRKRRAIVVAAR